LAGRRCTTLVLEDMTIPAGGLQLHSIVHGVLLLEQSSGVYGHDRRRLRVAKIRGSTYQSGYHDFLIGTGQVLVFPSLISGREQTTAPPERVESEVPELDALLGGGLTRGTVTMLIGPSGVGKSSLSLQYTMAAIRRGETAAIFAFEETYSTFVQRATGLGHDVPGALASGRLIWEDVKPTRISPGEFTWCVRRHIEDRNVRIVVIDSLNSYLGALPAERELMLHMHELLHYLNQRRVTTMLILGQNGVIGDIRAPIDLSFLSDAIVLLRFFEASGEVRKAISVVKNRTAPHEASIREYRMLPSGIRLGPALMAFQGVLTGVPTYSGSAETLLPQYSDE